MNILYLDPVFGISGDMTISALIDAGCPFSVLSDVLGQLPLDLPSISPEKNGRVTEGTYLRIGESRTHLSVTQMRQMAEGLRVEDRVKTDASGHPRVIVDAEAKAHGVRGRTYISTSFPTSTRSSTCSAWRGPLPTST